MSYQSSSSQVSGSGAAPRRKVSPETIGAFAILVDALAIVVTGRIARLGYDLTAGSDSDRSLYFGMSVMVALLFIVLMRSRGLYDPSHLLMLERQLKSAVGSWLLALGLVIVFAFLMKSGSDLSRGTSTMFAVLGLVAVLSVRILGWITLTRAAASGFVHRRQAVLVSATAWQTGAAQIASLQDAGIETAQSFFLPVDPEGRKAALARVIGYARSAPVDEVIVVMPTADLSEADSLVEALRPLPLPIRLLPDATLSRLALQPAQELGGFALIDLAREPLTAGERATKRALDMGIAALALLASAPLVLIAIAAIQLDTKGPALFRQTRRGFNGRTFKILKLRTMSVLEDGDGIAQATRGDPRVTRVGAWLRRTSIDELPQLWNVLRGEMSIVGPRPHAVAHDTMYDAMIENYAFRHHVKPGLTGWAQVNGHRGETPRVAMMAARIDHDIWYVNNWSLLLDVRIIVLTFTRLFARAAY